MRSIPLVNLAPFQWVPGPGESLHAPPTERIPKCQVPYQLRGLLWRGVVGQTGEICLDILKSAWSPAWTLQSTCQAILALMSDAAPDSPLNCDAGNLLRAGDVRGYDAVARMYTAEHAAPK